MKVISGIIGIAGTLALTFTLFTVGYFACSFPLTTEVLSQNTSNFVDSPYALDDLNALAVASRDYTVDPRPAGSTPQEARTAFNQVVMNAATHSATRYLEVAKDSTDQMALMKQETWSDLLTALKTSRPNDAFGVEDVDKVAAKMAKLNGGLALDEESFNHLDDCNALINSVVPWAKYAAIIALVCFLLLLVLRRWRELGRMLTVAPLILIVCFAWMGAWALLDFSSFFTAFHGVFFPQGNWTFPVDSLLICMYPRAFWVGMGAVWLVFTVLASIVVLAIGRMFAGIADRAEEAEMTDLYY